MRLSIQQIRELLERYGCYVTEACDKCGQILDAVRFTLKEETGEWCSRECRGDTPRQRTRKGGRPRKYRTEAARRRAERQKNAQRQQAYRARVKRNGKPPRTLAETKDLQAQKSCLSHYPSSEALGGPKAA